MKTIQFYKGRFSSLNSLASFNKHRFIFLGRHTMIVIVLIDYIILLKIFDYDSSKCRSEREREKKMEGWWMRNWNHH